ncbi:VTT domain-containing protein [Geoalkalibacter halelectricus]|uniref:VTT domain-containing protein n=1 Tax=Geoalkalibacter halelectricus TaxID=2847045 RepID=A0ABY5ZGD3_9BACT|nr:VTT domain-containing protein [Geoalkalibacter halelectricus]MDO3380241.1 VTT domain-containing protein [Geoalkalibacter halelectricus]UWZ78192.1 VTT domain-containing protein [Geoalkalibacter halelectricus]
MNRCDEIIKPGENCWRACRADQAALLIDGAAYFQTLAWGLEQARHTIFIIGWDIDSQIVLRRGAAAGKDEPDLVTLLNRLAREHQQLNIYVLDWDFTMLYALDRELLPSFKFSWSAHERLHFLLDDQHPVGASHHQKIVVIDDCLAFCGGLDLTHGRWDTPEHHPENPHRSDSDLKYPPFHDVQLMVSGEVAAALGTLSRRRWRCAGGEEPAPPVDTADRRLWPSDLAAEFKNTTVAISRTESAYAGQEPIKEVRRLWIDAIAAAEKSIYIENQFFTAYEVCQALEKRLKEPKGPEVVMILSGAPIGWLARKAMEMLGAQMRQRLQAADRFGRLRVVYPVRAGQFIKVHSKLLIVDDCLLRVGSANLNNRSMGLDTECDLALVAEEPQAHAAISRQRARLLAEHLGRTPEEVQRACEDLGSLGAYIDEARGHEGTRQLLSFENSTDSGYEKPPLDYRLIDPEKPISFEELTFLIQGGRKTSDRQVDRQHMSVKTAKRKVLRLCILLCAALVLAVAWRWTPLQEYLSIEVLRGWAETVQATAYSPLILMVIYVLGGFVLLPVTLMILVTVLTFGPWLGLLYAVCGTLLSAVSGYWAGRKLGREAVRNLSGERLSRINRALARKGLWAMIALRVLPLAPFTVGNLAAGASQIKLRDFILGTLIGMSPGFLAFAAFAGGFEIILRKPDPLSTVLFLAVAAGGGAMFWMLRKFILRKIRSKS